MLESLTLSYSRTRPVRITAQEPRRFGMDITSASTTQYNQSHLYHGRLQDGKEVTVKFSTLDDGPLREYDGLRLAHAHGVHVPNVFGVVEREQEPRTSVLMETISGVPLGRIPERKGAYLRDVGVELANLHSIPVSGFGKITDGVPEYPAFKDYINHLAADALPYFYENKKGSELLKDLHNQMLLREGPIEAKAVHGDVNDYNIMLQDAGNIVLVDLESWKGAEPMEDVGMYNYYLVRNDRPEQHRTDLLDGYTDGVGLPEDQLLPFMYYTLLYAARAVKFTVDKYPDAFPVKDVQHLSHVAQYVKEHVV